MSIVDAWKTCAMQKYADFSGRSRRREYWGFMVVNLAIYLAIILIYLVLGAIEVFLGLYLLFGAAMLVPTVAASVRRLHDTGRSGWLLLLGFVPFIGGLILLYFYVSDSDPGVNNYGPSPKYGA